MLKYRLAAVSFYSFFCFESKDDRKHDLCLRFGMPPAHQENGALNLISGLQRNSGRLAL
jgi:hypothetical protein